MPQPPFSALRARRGFTIIEVIVVVIIIGLMLLLIVPHLFSELKMRKAGRIKDDLMTLNSAIEHYALDNGKMGGVQPSYADLRKYLDPKTDVYRRNGKDVFGESYGPFTIGTRPSVPAQGATKLSDVASQDFWSPFQ